jgi:hypothetical protein
MLGFISGILLAIWYRREGPQEPVPEWLDDDDDEIIEDEKANSEINRL